MLVRKARVGDAPSGASENRKRDCSRFPPNTTGCFFCCCLLLLHVASRSFPAQGNPIQSEASDVQQEIHTPHPNQGDEIWIRESFH